MCRLRATRMRSGLDWLRESGSLNQNLATPARTRLGLDHDLDIMIERIEKPNEAFDRKPAQPSISQRRNLRLIDAQNLCGLRLTQVSVPKHALDFQGKASFRQTLFGARQLKISKNISSARGYLNFCFHNSSPNQARHRRLRHP